MCPLSSAIKTAFVIIGLNMDQALKSKWVSALRSGDFKKGRYRLKKDDKFCCLGVLCSISELPEHEFVGSSEVYFAYGDEKALTLLPESFRCHVGLEAFFETLLVGRNDSGESFEDISRFIEENLEVTA